MSIKRFMRLLLVGYSGGSMDQLHYTRSIKSMSALEQYLSALAHDGRRI